VKKTHPWWKVEGEWPRDEQREILLGARLAKKLQRTASRPGYIYLQDRETKISGILHTGDVEEDAVIAPIAMVQELIGRPGAVRRVFVSALTKPEDEFARRDPRTMSPEMLERWSCTPYANSIAYQIGEALPNVKAEQIRKIAQNEGVVLSKISGLMSLVALAAVLASVLAVSAAMAAGILERRREIGLLKSLGAANFSVGSLFAAEAALLGLAGAGFGCGRGLLARAEGFALCLPVECRVATGAGAPHSTARHLRNVCRKLSVDPQSIECRAGYGPAG
jgi:putative ABC transport system permease protein